VPTEPIPALLYVCLLLPGIAFIWRYEGHSSTIKRSAFRETSAVVIASAASLVAVFVIHYVLAFFSEPFRTTLREFFVDPGELFRQDSQLFFGIVLGDLALAVAFGAFFGSAAASRLQKSSWAGWLRLWKKKPATLERNQSAWNAAFERFPDHKVIVGVHLKSGNWVQGVLDTHSRSGDESPDRAFTLVGDLWYQTATGEEAHKLESHAAVIIQAPEIDYLTVGYQRPTADDNVIDS
jgi:hypothetical protein